MRAFSTASAASRPTTEVAAAVPDMRMSAEDMASLMIHADQCHSAACGTRRCDKMKKLLRHFNTCRTRAISGCVHCRRVMVVIVAHAKTCKKAYGECLLPSCGTMKRVFIKEHAKTCTLGAACPDKRCVRNREVEMFQRKKGSAADFEREMSLERQAELRRLFMGAFEHVPYCLGVSCCEFPMCRDIYEANAHTRTCNEDECAHCEWYLELQEEHALMCRSTRCVAGRCGMGACANLAAATARLRAEDRSVTMDACAVCYRDRAECARVCHLDACPHQFCLQCVRGFSETNGACPLCRVGFCVAQSVGATKRKLHVAADYRPRPNNQE